MLKVQLNSWWAECGGVVERQGYCQSAQESWLKRDSLEREKEMLMHFDNLLLSVLASDIFPVCRDQVCKSLDRVRFRTLIQFLRGLWTMLFRWTRPFDQHRWTGPRSCLKVDSCFIETAKRHHGFANLCRPAGLVASRWFQAELADAMQSGWNAIVVPCWLTLAFCLTSRIVELEFVWW